MENQSATCCFEAEYLDFKCDFAQFSVPACRGTPRMFLHIGSGKAALCKNKTVVFHTTAAEGRRRYQATPTLFNIYI